MQRVQNLQVQQLNINMTMECRAKIVYQSLRLEDIIDSAMQICSERRHLFTAVVAVFLPETIVGMSMFGSTEQNAQRNFRQSLERRSFALALGVGDYKPPEL